MEIGIKNEADLNFHDFFTSSLHRHGVRVCDGQLLSRVEPIVEGHLPTRQPAERRSANPSVLVI